MAKKLIPWDYKFENQPLKL